MPLVISYIQ